MRALKAVAHPNDGTLQPVDVNQLLIDTIIVSRSEWKHLAKVDTDLDPDIGRVHGAAGPLNQVFLNLLVNAAHAVEDRYGADALTEGRIVVASRSHEGSVEVRVTDNGCGIREEIRSRIFDPFFTTKAMGRGTGQGLAITHGIVTSQHQRTITVEAREGTGTTFVVSLPVSVGVAAAQSA